jgi:hypothetical protein
MKIQIGAGNEYIDFCCPHPQTGSGLYQSTEGLGFDPDPNLRVRPIPRVICAFPGVHSEQLIYWMEARGADVSLYSGPAYFTQRQQLDDIIKLTEANLEQNRYFIAPIDPNYRVYLTQNKIEYAMMHPDKTMKLIWHRLLRGQAGNSASDLKAFFNQWDRTIQELEDVSTTDLAQRYRIVIKNKAMFVTDVPDYLKPESSRIRMHLDSYHDEYVLSHGGGRIMSGKEPIYQINGEVYGRVKEHTIKLRDVA